MTQGASYPSFAMTAHYAMASGAANPDYPVANLANLKAITRPFRASGSGALSIAFTLTEAAAIQFVALCRHNAPDAATWQVQLYSDAAMLTEVYDSGTLTISVAAGSLFRKTAPHLLASPITAIAGVLTLSNTGLAWQIGGVELAGFWEIAVPATRSVGQKPQDAVTELPGGVSQATRQFSPRTAGTSQAYIDWSVDGDRFLDFQNATGLSEPFVWMRAYDFATSWARECFLARNAALVNLGKSGGFFGSTGLSMLEHLG